ncbi:MAG: AAA family ATPase [Oscillospiraceae bacterium]|nr:AAA family ATPase [Oscillospiraceae bacterium]
MDIKQSLIANNNWWSGEKISSKFLLGRKREEFDNIIEKLDEKRILSIVGPRRVGKSILIYQTINHLLEDKKIHPKRILFFSGDDPSLFFNENDKLSDVLDIYFKEILSEDVASLDSKVYIFIDEVHFIKNWQNFLKVYFDRKYDVKFIVTGSSSVHLYKDANESLMGRIENIHVLPLTFNQFLNFHQTYIKKEVDIVIPKFDLDKPIDSFEKLDKFYYDEKLKLKICTVLKQYILVRRIS